eukprot:2227938-Pleurochrysis_carterae.AAC.4
MRACVHARLSQCSLVQRLLRLLEALPAVYVASNAEQERHTHAHEHARAHTHTPTRTCQYAYIRTRNCTHARTCTRARTDTLTHAHTHPCSQTPARAPARRTHTRELLESVAGFRGRELKAGFRTEEGRKYGEFEVHRCE